MLIRNFVGFTLGAGYASRYRVYAFERSLARARIQRDAWFVLPLYFDLRVVPLLRMISTKLEQLRYARLRPDATRCAKTERRSRNANEKFNATRPDSITRYIDLSRKRYYRVARYPRQRGSRSSAHHVRWKRVIASHNRCRIRILYSNGWKSRFVGINIYLRF